MSLIRPLEPADIPAVAGLFQAAFRDPGRPPPRSLADYLRSHYLEAPVCDPEIPSLVHLGEGGAVSGFIGSQVLPMRFGERRLRAAICSSIMVDPQAHDAMAAPRLARSFLAGPQDLSLTESASAPSAQIWKGLRGITLPQYSLDWIRVIRPAAFALDLAARRSSMARHLGPLARGVDGVVGRRLSHDALHWAGVPTGWRPKGGLEAVETDEAGFAALIEPLTRQFPLRPDWSDGQLRHILAEASRKPNYGEAVFASARASGGMPVGAFVYHVKPGGLGRVLQLLALPGQVGAVFDCLLAHAAERGAAGLRGRTQPPLLAATLGQKVAYTQPAATALHARDPAVVEAFVGGKGFFNGLAGEHWSRFVGGSFD